MLTIADYLQNNSYPGRGIILGRSEDGMHAYLAYFIMGRSENSRNRVFVESHDGVVIHPADPSKVEDPSLIIYSPVRRHNQAIVVSNGDQTDTIYEHLAQGKSFEAALRTRTFEPDSPNFTPRISGLLELGYAGFSYVLSIIKTCDMGKSKQLHFWEFPEPQPGQGHFVHTYAQDSNPLPSFKGEPVPINIAGSLPEFGNTIWQNLNAENKISLYVKSVSLDGHETAFLYNKYTNI